MGPIRPRFYSISSSLANPRHVRLTVGLLEGPALAGEGEYRGLCSQYLGRLEPGDVFYGYVRVPSPTFDPATPLILIGPGTGIAPLRGFLEERAWQHENGTQGGTSQVFAGCRHPQHDWFYRDEMQTRALSGIARVHTAFSAVPDHQARFVQNAIVAASDTLWEAHQLDQRSVVNLWQRATRTPGAQATSGTLLGRVSRPGQPASGGTCHAGWRPCRSGPGHEGDWLPRQCNAQARQANHRRSG
ncbi:hypothetical protein ACWDA7_39275 [Streptomyces sp. NPDC001156]